MLLLGAGASVPFGIPAMKIFVINFKKQLLKNKSQNGRTINAFFKQIESALKKSETLVGTEIPFDLESLMIVLQDLVASKDSPISAPTFAFMLCLITQKETEVGESNIADIRRTFRRRAQTLLDLLRGFIFDKCFEPIRIGIERNPSTSLISSSHLFSAC